MKNKITKKLNYRLLFSILILLFATSNNSWAFLEFDFSNNLVPLKELKRGGVPKDGIPAILMPEIVTAEEAKEFMNDSDRIMSLSVNGEHRAYPIKILNWHELVNDRLGDRDVLVSFCPLCGTGLVFERNIGDEALIFGVSGLLYNSDLLFYDDKTDSLWSQIEGKAITGKFSGKKLKLLPSLHTSWEYWKNLHPDTTVALPELGYMNSYDANEYEEYNKSKELYFKVSKRDPRFHPKERVIGTRLNGVAKAYFFSKLNELSSPVKDTLGGEKIMVHYDKKSSTAYITDMTGNVLESIVGFWFAWYAFNSDTLVYKNPTPQGSTLE